MTEYQNGNRKKYFGTNFSRKIIGNMTQSIIVMVNLLCKDSIYKKKLFASDKKNFFDLI